MELHFQRLRQTTLLMPLLAVVWLLSGIQTAFAGNCDNPRYAAKNPDVCDPGDPGTDPPEETKVLRVTVYYGDEASANPSCVNDQPALDETCINTTFEVEGTVTCSSQVCDFARTNEDNELYLESGVNLGIPPSQLNLLALTSIRGTDIVPAYCFETQYGDVGDFMPDDPPTGFEQYDYPGLTLGTINGFFLRSPVVTTVDDPQKWWAHVWALSDDMNGYQRQYRFNFGGECNLDGDRCPLLREGDFEGDFGNGFAGGVFGANTNSRGDGQTCRCTVSSKPGCPDHVNMGDGVLRPASWITIEDITLD